MANRTVKDASTVKGTNPQYLIEKVVRSRIYDSRYWKEECFALSAELLVDKGMELRFVGGVFGGNVKPSPFLCLQLKMLQIQPDKDIVIEFIRQEDSKYIRALGAMYLRLTFTSVEIYQYLEPLLNDYRKLRWMNKQGKFELMHMDEFVDRLLREERFCDIQLPRLQKRDVLEETGQLQKRISLIDEELEYLSSSESEGENGIDEKPSRPNRPSDEQRKSRNRSPRRRSPSGGRRRDKLHKSADERQQRRSRSRHRSRSRDRRRQRRRSKEQLTTTGRRSP
uniref:Pre-mRNA-splicing factor 38 n=1 Tax=Trichuris muris TaxID=70415 RepID=A0A5S6QI22_TRIMR